MNIELSQYIMDGLKHLYDNPTLNRVDYQLADGGKISIYRVGKVIRIDIIES